MFAPDRPFRHVIQHIFAALIGYFILTLFLIVPSISSLTVFFLSTILIDLDGITYILLHPSQPQVKHVLKALLHGKISQAGIIAVTHHKEFNRLLLHNILGFFLVLIIFLISISERSNLVTAATGAILTHFIFDILDDLHQLKHLKNWLWPLRLLFPS